MPKRESKQTPSNRRPVRGLTLTQEKRLADVVIELDNLASFNPAMSPRQVLSELLRIDDDLILPLMDDVQARAARQAAKEARNA